MTNAFRDLLLPGERLVWSARPVPWAGFTPKVVGQLVVGLGALAWTLWSFFGTVMAWRMTFAGLIPITAFITVKTVLVPALAGIAGFFAVWGLVTPVIRLRHEVYGLSGTRGFFASGPVARRLALVAEFGAGGVAAVERWGPLSTLMFEIAVPLPDDIEKNENLRFENLCQPDFDAAVKVLNARSGGGDG